jgi:hypothetical protein
LPVKTLILSLALSTFGCIAWAAGAPPLDGKVLEVKDVDSYTYLRLRTRDGEIWAAVNRSPVKVGADVAVADPVVMNNFQSKTLGRTFDRIVFGVLAASGASAPSGSRDTGSPHAGMAKPAEVVDVKVAKATGPDARTVAEVNARRVDLKGKPVVVRGKVVKFTPGVMGKNWLHLRDGSGTEADGSNDVAVTTLDETKVGDVVLVKGIVVTDRDLGSGYSYKVLIEEATLR